MITNFTKKAGLAAAIAIVSSTAANAAVFNASASFRTIADITITEVQALSFGTAVTGKAGTDCTLAAVITPATPAAVVDPNATTTGAGCPSTSDAAVGSYTLVGASGSTVTLLMATSTDADFSFAPAGDYSDQESGGGADIVTTYFADSPTNVVLNGTAGKTGMLAVGGTLSILNDLAASTSFAVAYDVSVVY